MIIKSTIDHLRDISDIDAESFEVLKVIEAHFNHRDLYMLIAENIYENIRFSASFRFLLRCLGICSIHFHIKHILPVLQLIENLSTTIDEDLEKSPLSLRSPLIFDIISFLIQFMESISRHDNSVLESSLEKVDLIIHTTLSISKQVLSKPIYELHRIQLARELCGVILASPLPGDMLYTLRQPFRVRHIMDRMLVFMLWKQISHDKQRHKADGDNDCWLELPSIIDDISASRNNCFSLFSGTHRRSTLCCIPWSSITDDQFSSILKEYITFCCISKHMLLDLEVEQLMICLEEDNFDIYDHLVHKALRLISMHHLSYKRNSLSWSLSGISLLMHCILVGETSSITRNRSPPTSYSLTLVPHSPAFMWNTLSPSLFSLFQQRGNHIEALESLSKLVSYRLTSIKLDCSQQCEKYVFFASLIGVSWKEDVHRVVCESLIYNHDNEWTSRWNSRMSLVASTVDILQICHLAIQAWLSTKDRNIHNKSIFALSRLIAWRERDEYACLLLRVLMDTSPLHQISGTIIDTVRSAVTILPQKLDNKILSAVSNNGKTDIVPRSPAIDVSDDTATHLYHKSLDSYVLTHRLLETILQWFVILPLKDLQQDDIGTDADISDVINNYDVFAASLSLLRYLCLKKCFAGDINLMDIAISCLNKTRLSLLNHEKSLQVPPLSKDGKETEAMVCDVPGQDAVGMPMERSQAYHPQSVSIFKSTQHLKLELLLMAAEDCQNMIYYSC